MISLHVLIVGFYHFLILLARLTLIHDYCIRLSSTDAN